MTLGRLVLPANRPPHRFPRILKSCLQPATKEADVSDNFINIMTLEIAFRYRLKMVLNLFPKVAGQPLGNRGLKIRPLDAALLEEFTLVTEIAGSRLIKLPNQRLLPIRPIL